MQEQNIKASPVPMNQKTFKSKESTPARKPMWTIPRINMDTIDTRYNPNMPPKVMNLKENYPKKIYRLYVQTIS